MRRAELRSRYEPHEPTYCLFVTIPPRPLGRSGQSGQHGDPMVQAAMDRIIAAGRPVGVAALSPQAARQLIARGIDTLVIDAAALLQIGARAFMEARPLGWSPTLVPSSASSASCPASAFSSRTPRWTHDMPRIHR